MPLVAKSNDCTYNINARAKKGKIIGPPSPSSHLKKAAEILKNIGKTSIFGTIFDNKTSYNIKIMTTHPCPLTPRIVTVRHAMTRRVS